MGQYVEINGVKTWYDEQGSGDPLLLMHGGLMTNDTWGMQTPAFAERFHVYALERRGHGHTPDTDGPMTYKDTVADAIAFIETVVGRPTHIVGFSDGGNVGLLVASERPDLVRKLVAIGANFNTEGMVPEAGAMLEHMTPDAPDLAMFRSMYVEASPDGPDHWPAILEKTTKMWTTEPNMTSGDLARITSPTLVMVADDDMIPLEHAIETYRSIPNAQLAVVPGTSHVLLMEKADFANGIILDFLQDDPAPTMMPFRRAGS